MNLGSFFPRSLPRSVEGPTIRILSLAGHSYLDDADDRAAAHRAFVAGLARAGIAVEVLTGATLSAGPEVDPAAWLAARGRAADALAIAPPADAPPPPWPHPPSQLRLDVDGVAVHLFRGPSTRPHDPDDAEVFALLFLLDLALGRSRPSPWSPTAPTGSPPRPSAAPRPAASPPSSGPASPTRATSAPSPSPTPCSPPPGPSPTTSTRSPDGPAPPSPTSSTPRRSAPRHPTRST